MRTHHFGFTLSECLTSLFIMSFISILLVQIYIMHQRYYWQFNQLLDEDLDVQWVSELLTHSVRSAGFTPCLSIDNLESVDTRFAGKHIKSMYVEEGVNSKLSINRMEEHFAQVIDISQNQLLVADKLSYSNTPIILIADCMHAEIHRVGRPQKTTRGWRLNLETPLVFSYPGTAYVGLWLEEQWFIKKNHQQQRALYYKQQHSEELTPFIQSFAVTSHWQQQMNEVSIVLGLSSARKEELHVRVRA